MSRSRSSIAAALVLAALVTLGTLALPETGAAATLKSRLCAARTALHESRDRLKTAEVKLAAAVAAAEAGLTSTEVVADSPVTPEPTASGSPAPPPPPGSSIPTDSPAPSATPTPCAAPALTIDELRARVAKARRGVRMWTKRVRRLSRSYRQHRRMAEWERRGDWLPIIRVAAARYDVKAAGMYRMMMRESGGERFAGSGRPFKGLFQYWTVTWSAAWNPWREDSIYDGSSQIFATAYAIHKGLGPQMWTTTFAAQY